MVSLLIWVVGKIQFVVIIIGRSPFPYWLSTENCSQLLEATHIPQLWSSSSTFKASSNGLSFFHRWNLSSSFCLIALTRKVSQCLRTRVTGLGSPNNPGSSPHIKVHILGCICKVLFTGYSLGVRMWTSLGDHDSAYYSLCTRGF